MVTPESVNFVNAGLYAEQRGIGVTVTKKGESRDYVNLIKVTTPGEDGPVAVAGTLVGKKNEPRLVSLYDYDLDMAPSRYMAFFRYEDVPGMIGKIGTVLGENDINIASMQVGRTKMGGQAVMGINVDTPIGPGLLERIVEEVGIDQAWRVEL
jgi:D-3-phosphoglycerate dehydrogenase